MMAHYISTILDINSKQFAKLYFNYIFRLYGLPDSVVLDWEIHFTSKFTRVYYKLVEVR